MFRRLWKPWLVYQPRRLVRRALSAFASSPAPGYSPLPTSWGVPVIADPTRTIGRSIFTTGIYDVAVSEALARLISPGDTVVDAGANVGYMTILASVAAGPRGRVLSFEPHPELFAVLERNVAAVRAKFDVARTELYRAALGEQRGTATLQLPPDFGANDGIARISRESIQDGQSFTVQVETLDDVLASTSAAVLKLDVEGFEPQVLRGATRALNESPIRHIVFEDHAIAESEVVRILRKAGYRVFSLGWSLRGLVVEPVEVGSLATSYEAPSYIATRDPAEVLARCRPRGWRVLSKRYSRRAATALSPLA